ncbi:MAG: LapA family protein [Methylophilaceae bacterium]|nr:LapA family protein [Methylophilaceae bacterium]
MRYLYALVAFILFIAVLGFAVKNGTPVTVHYYLGVAWHAPLVLVILVSLITGIALGIAACLGLIIRQRRALSALRHELAKLGAPTVPPSP